MSQRCTLAADGSFRFALVWEICGKTMSNSSGPTLMITIGKGSAWGVCGLALTTLSAVALVGSVLPEFSLAADITPIGLWVSAALLGTSLCFRIGWTSRLPLAVAVAFFGILAGPEAAARAAQSVSRPSVTHTLKVMAANVQSNNLDHGPFLDYLRAKQPDIVVVSETYGDWMIAFQSLYPSYRVAAGCALVHQCDVVVLTKLAPAGGQMAPLSSLVVANVILPEQLGGDRISVMGVHLSRVASDARTALDLIAGNSTGARFGPADIMAGDFNATPWGANLRYLDDRINLRRHTRWLPTWPARWGRQVLPSMFAMAPIDHIYAGKAWRLVDVERGPYIGSDHYPVLASFARDHS